MRLRWGVISEVGAGDAAATALLCGALQNAFLAMGAIASGVVMHQSGYVSVRPSFKDERLYLNFNCIASVRIGNIIAILLKSFVEAVRNGKSN